LREVYGEQLAIRYRMGGMADRIEDWMQEYGVGDEGVVAWMKESVELTRMPTDIHAYRKTGVKSSSPAWPSRRRSCREKREQNGSCGV
jgi:hypothetical protein